MATTFVDYTGDGNATKAFSFPSYKVEDIKVDVDGVIKTSGNHYNITSYTTTGGGNVVFTSGNIPASPANIRIYRDTDVDSAKATYTAGSSVKAGDLNNNNKQLLYAAQEEKNQTIQASDIKDGAITSAKIVDGTIVNADINASAAIAGTKISPDFGSQNIATTGTINNLTTTELAILDGATVSTAELNKLDGVTSSTSELNILDGVTASTAEINKLDGVTASTAEINKLDGLTASTSELNILDGVTASTAEINKLDGLTATTTELNQAAGITSGIQSQIDGKQPLDSELTELATMGSGTAGALADLNTAEVQTLDGITASTAELNLLDGKSIVTTIGGSATDVQLPSAQAVNERIVELVTEVGGFAPIANETSFPATNPDINDGAGTIVSIKALASNLTANGSGVATIANGAGTGNTVTINGLTAGSTISAGLGVLVETTTTLHTYTFHRQVVDSAGVSNAQTLVSDFNDRYQISASAPSTHPDGSALGDGDLWFDTSANVMKVYDLGNTQYNTVASVGDFKLLTVVPDGATSGSPTFDGNIVSYDLRDGTNAASITNVGQLFVSLNGVVQKPNAGSYNASNEGFYLEGTNGIKFCTAPASGSSLFVTQIGAATSIGTPSDNTVTEAKLQSDAVSEAKLKVSNSPVNGYFLSAQSGNTGGLTWAQVNTELVGDTSPQLGGDLDVQSSKVTTSTTNGNVKIEPNGTGVVEVRGAGGADGTLQLNCSAQSHGVKIKSPAHSAGATYTLTLPVNIQNGYLLTTDANGQTSWTNSVPSSYLTGALPAIDGSNLTGLQAGATGGNSGGNAVFWENQQTVTHDYSISANRNAGSFGPITINSGITVTVPSTSNWTIV
jgi:hypothetical protein